MLKKINSPTVLTPTFIPRFQLVEAELVGFEMQVKPAQRHAPFGDAFYRAVVADDAAVLLHGIGTHFSDWESKVRRPLTLSVEVGLTVAHEGLGTCIGALAAIVPVDQLEIVINTNGIGWQGLQAVNPLLKLLSEVGCRKGLLHNSSLSFPLDGLAYPLDTVKLYKSAIAEIQDDITASSQLVSLLGALNEAGIGIVVDGLYTKQDVTLAILMGAGYGQGYYLTKSRVGPYPRLIKLKKNPATDIYENIGFDAFLYGGVW